jgi:hypothetical protein
MFFFIVLTASIPAKIAGFSRPTPEVRLRPKRNREEG